MRIYFVRHGQSVANTARVISNRNLPHPLTELGRQQATALAQSLAAVKFEQIYASPILRAVQTAEIVAAALGVPFDMADALREPDCGIMEGRADEAAWAEHKRVTLDWLLHEKFDSHLDGGESHHAVRARFVPFIQQLIDQHHGTDHNLLLIAHGSVLYMMLPVVLCNVTLAFAREQPMPNTAVIMAEERADGLVGVEWCGVKI